MGLFGSSFGKTMGKTFGGGFGQSLGIIGSALGGMAGGEDDENVSQLGQALAMLRAQQKNRPDYRQQSMGSFSFNNPYSQPNWLNQQPQFNPYKWRKGGF